MAGFPPSLPAAAMPDGPGAPSPAPGPTPMPAAALAAARPPAPPSGGGMGGMSQHMLLFLAGQGFKSFVESMKKLRGDDKKSDKKTQAGGLVQQLGMRQMPQNAITPGGGPVMPPMLAGGQSPGFLAMLAKLQAATEGNQS